MLAFIPMFIASAVFWSLYQQQFTVRHDLLRQATGPPHLFGWEMPVVLGAVDQPGLHHHPVRRVRRDVDEARRPRQPSTPIKFAAGTVIMGIAFLLFIPMAGGGPNSAPLLGLVGILFVFTFAELLLSPVGLSLSTKLAPEAFHTQMVALFFLSVALGTAMSGTLAEFYSPDQRGRVLRRPRRRSRSRWAPSSRRSARSCAA